MNVASKVREGYELVRSEEYPDFPVGKWVNKA
jgi:hypothetical protein